MIRRRSLALTLRLLVTFAIFSWQPTSSYGQTRDWNEPAGGLYGYPFNWSGFNVADGPAENARFNISATYDVTFSDNREVADLLVFDGNVHLSTHSSAAADITYAVGNDVDIDGGFVTLTEIANALNVHLDVYDQVRIGDGQLNIFSGSQVSSAGFVLIGNNFGDTGIATVNGTESSWTNSNGLTDLLVGRQGQGTLTVEAGGMVSNSGNGLIGGLASGVGTATVTGTGSTWTNSGEIGTGELIVGGAGQGTLSIEEGGQVSNTGVGMLGNLTGSVGTVIVTDPGSTWTNSSDFYVGRFGQGTLSIAEGGQVSNVGRASIGDLSNSVGTVTVTGPGSTWTNSSDLIVGSEGNGTLYVNESGLVTVAGTTSINATSSVVMGGGRFEFGTIDLTSFARIGGTSGELAGNLPALNGYNDTGTLPASLGSTTLDLSEVLLTNHGILFGSGSFDVGLSNSVNGEIETSQGERLRFGQGTNMGEINNFGGQVRFEQDFTNQAAGFVGGRGQFIANGGWTNEGVLAFSGGFADVLGDVANSATGQVVVAGGSVTTFFDDVTMDASNLNIEVALGSTAVFLGSYNGGNDGTGAIEVLGDLRPGNSPAGVTFGGDLTLGMGANTFIELAGTASGEYDRLEVDGDLNLAGDLMVSLLGNFELDVAMEFIIAEVEGALTSVFANFADGDLVGTFNGIELFIDYDAVDGNDVALFTAGLLGDFDLDADDDGADFLAWQREFSTEFNSGDLDDWQANYGMQANAIAAATNVPEPSTLAICLGLCLVRVVRRRR